MRRTRSLCTGPEALLRRPVGFVASSRSFVTPFGRNSSQPSAVSRQLLADSCLLFKPEVVLVQFGDAGEFLGCQIGRLRSGGELFYLLFAVDVREGGDYFGGGEDELEGGLAQGTLAGCGEEGELLHLLEARREPLFRAVAAMVVLGEGRVLVVVAFQHPRGVGDAYDQGRVRLAGRLDEVPARILFEEVVDHLHAFYIALAHGLYAFFEPPDLGTQGDAVGPDLAFVLELLHEGEELVILDGIHLGVV